MSLEHYKAASERTDADERGLISAFKRTASERGTSDASLDEVERWVATTLVNDEASSDSELIEHFQQGDEIPYEQAKFYVAQRNRALKHGLTFRLESYQPAPNKAQHSPLPWEIIYTDNEIETTGCGAVKARFNRDNEKMRAEAEANAALIVRAVNNADKLAEALSIALNAFTYSSDGVIRFSDNERSQIRAALTAYNKESQ